MRKMRVALVTLLLLAFFAASYVGSATTTISPRSMGDALSIGNSRALLQNIEKKLVSGNSGIAKANEELGAMTKYMAKQNIANVTKVMGANKTNATVKPPSMRRYTVPMTGIGDAIKALGSIHMKIAAPVEIARSLSPPRLAVMA